MLIGCREAEAAAEILNRERHRGHANWRYMQRRTPGVLTLLPVWCVAPSDDFGVIDSRQFHLDGFEAVAIAEKYLRDKESPKC